tara:strand:- start:23907 stop:24146 length:240 start_codon:yes stop_codon:yes gene_type:complete
MQRWVDNVFIERLWRSVKYEEVYLKAYEGMRHARESLKTYLLEFTVKRDGTMGLNRRPQTRCTLKINNKWLRKPKTETT